MNALRHTTTVKKNKLIIHIPKTFLYKDVEVIVLPIDNSTKKNYDFSDVVGKLHWKGNAVTEQRKLRDEWK
jgi:hypothetical protein